MSASNFKTTCLAIILMLAVAGCGSDNPGNNSPDDKKSYDVESADQPTPVDAGTDQGELAEAGSDEDATIVDPLAEYQWVVGEWFCQQGDGADLNHTFNINFDEWTPWVPDKGAKLAGQAGCDEMFLKKEGEDFLLFGTPIGTAGYCGNSSFSFGDEIVMEFDIFLPATEGKPEVKIRYLMIKHD